ncbi:MAG: hypothetical protein U5S82_14065 [Gammaproteobacteria bacterium]|nr:hypothetical protein [Gammaproteobacteria bacterium]
MDALGPILGPLAAHLAKDPHEPLPPVVVARLLEALQRAATGASLAKALAVGPEPTRDAAIVRAADVVGGSTPWEQARRVAEAVEEYERGRMPDGELARAVACIVTARRPVRTPEGLYSILRDLSC